MTAFASIASAAAIAVEQMYRLPIGSLSRPVAQPAASAQPVQPSVHKVGSVSVGTQVTFPDDAKHVGTWQCIVAGTRFQKVLADGTGLAARKTFSPDPLAVCLIA